MFAPVSVSYAVVKHQTSVKTFVTETSKVQGRYLAASKDMKPDNAHSYSQCLISLRTQLSIVKLKQNATGMLHE